jgi:hypothetical protein
MNNLAQSAFEGLAPGFCTKRLRLTAVAKIGVVVEMMWPSPETRA